MKIKTRLKSSGTLDSVAMTDIIMNLFIFFFVSFSLLYTFNPYSESKIKISLPRGTTQVKPEQDGPVIVSIDSGNQIYISGEQISPEKLIESLKTKAETLQRHGVIVRADKSAMVDFFVKVLDASKQAGVEKIAISIELDEK